MKKNIHKILRKPMFGRFEGKWVWPSSISQDNWERIEFQNDNKINLVGYWQTAPQPKATLVLAHPMGKAAKGFWLRYGHADLFLKYNFNVFIVDANGFGESEAASFDYPADFLAAGIYAKNRNPDLNIGLVGASFGAGWGLCAMARGTSPYKAAVLEAVFPTLPEFWQHYPFPHAAIQISKYVWPSIEKNLRPIEDAESLVGEPEVLLLFGDKDIYTPPEFGERLVKALEKSAQVEMKVFAGGDHTYLYRDQPEEYKETVIGFLEKSLCK